MIVFAHRSSVLLVLLLLCTSLVSTCTAQTHPTAAGRVASALGAAAASARRASIAGEIGLNALRNSMATCNERQQKLLLAVSTGIEADLEAAEEAWKKAIGDVDDTLEVARKITRYSNRSSSAYASARDEANKASKDPGERNAEASAKQAEHLAADAEKSAKTAESMAETLKKRWLIPPAFVAVPVPSATSTSVPMSDLPSSEKK